MNKKTIVIVPAYNEESNIERVIREIKTSTPACDIVVIDDGSGDLTAPICIQNNVNVISLPYNLGIGGAVQCGYKFAAEMGYDIAIQIDGDGQHYPSEVKKLIEPILTGDADFVIGSRYLKEGFEPSFARKIGSLYFAKFLSLVTGKRLTDTTSGFRAASTEVIDFFSKCYPTDYPEVESIVLLHYGGFKFMEVPVSMNKRQGGRSSITPVQSLYYMVKLTLSIFVNIFRKRNYKAGG